MKTKKEIRKILVIMDKPIDEWSKGYKEALKWVLEG